MYHAWQVTILSIAESLRRIFTESEPGANGLDERLFPITPTSYLVCLCLITANVFVHEKNEKRTFKAIYLSCICNPHSDNDVALPTWERQTSQDGME